MDAANGAQRRTQLVTNVERLNQEVERGRVRALYARVDKANEHARQHGLQGFAAVSNKLSLAVPTGPFYPGLVYRPIRQANGGTR